VKLLSAREREREKGGARRHSSERGGAGASVGIDRESILTCATRVDARLRAAPRKPNVQSERTCACVRVQMCEKGCRISAGDGISNSGRARARARNTVANMESFSGSWLAIASRVGTREIAESLTGARGWGRKRLNFPTFQTFLAVANNKAALN